MKKIQVRIQEKFEALNKRELFSFEKKTDLILLKLFLCPNLLRAGFKFVSNNKRKAVGTQITYFELFPSKHEHGDSFCEMRTVCVFS